MKRTSIFRILTLLYLAAVAFLCFGKFGSLPHSGDDFLGIPADKLVHFAMFLPFPVFAFFSLKTDRASLIGTMAVLLTVFVVGCLLAAATEYVQGKLPYRSMDPADFAADTYGLICGCVIAFLLSFFVRKKNHA